METESGVGARTYRYVYGLQKIETVIYGIANGAGSVMQYVFSDETGEWSLAGSVPSGVTVSNSVVKLYYHHDRLGTTDYITDNVAGKVISYVTYDDWGMLTAKANLKCGVRELDLVQEYTGHPYDMVLGLYFAEARMYDAASRRFMAVDAVKGTAYNTKTLTLYVFCSDNPIKYWDPTGNKSVVNNNTVKEMIFSIFSGSITNNSTVTTIKTGIFSNYTFVNNGTVAEYFSSKNSDIDIVNNGTIGEMDFGSNSEIEIDNNGTIGHINLSGINNAVSIANNGVIGDISINNKLIVENLIDAQEITFKKYDFLVVMSQSDGTNSLNQLVYMDNIPSYLRSSNSTYKMGVFAIRHPIAADKIGAFYSDNSNQISSRATRFSVNSGLAENSENIGSQRNAFRHVLWVSTITKVCGVAIAFEASAAHESNSFILLDSGYYSVYSGCIDTVFDTHLEADAAIDAANNLIGMYIGLNVNSSDMRDISIVIADYFYNEGLWVSQKTKDGKYTIKKQKLSKSEYNSVIKELKNLDENGWKIKK